MDNLLCYDPSKRPVETKISGAILKFLVKFGKYPTICLVSLPAIKGNSTVISGVTVKPCVFVHKNHFLVG